MFAIATAVAVGQNNMRIPVQIFMDQGSEITFNRNELTSALKPRILQKFHLDIDAVMSMTSSTVSNLVLLDLELETGEKITLSSFSVPEVCQPFPEINWPVLKSKWPHLVDLPLRKTGGKIDILLGLDHNFLFNSKEVRSGKINEPTANNTGLGWVPQGPTKGMLVKSLQTKVDLEKMVARLHETENFGIEGKQFEKKLSPDDQKALDLVCKGTTKLDLGYEVALPWKDGEPNLANNKSMAIKWFNKSLVQFKADPAYASEYKTALFKYIKDGYARKVEGSELEGEQFFLVHHGVRKNGVGKLRIVFNSAAKYQGKCLNDALLTGPPLQNVLPTAILKWRKYPVAYTADIEAMFSRIRMTDRDARFHRFIWKDVDSENYEVYQIERISFGNCCSPFIALQTIRQTVIDYSPDDDTSKTIRENLYVDDYLDSHQTEELAIQKATKVKETLAKGNFNLRSWRSNSKRFIKTFDGSQDSVDLLENDNVERVLGVTWLIKSDILTFKVNKTRELIFTKRGILRLIAGNFDPLGIASIPTTQARIRFRNIPSDHPWDKQIPESEKKWWSEWYENINKLDQLKVKRCLIPEPSKTTKIELHTFCDASPQAFAAAVYVRTVTFDEQIYVQLIMAKSKLAPKKTISMPKLELQACLLGSRLSKFVQDSLQIPDISRYIWTDSQIARNWVRSPSGYYDVFVSHRIGEIQTLTELDEWRFVPGKENPADLPTREEFSKFLTDKQWINGPDFLWKPESLWPADIPKNLPKEDIRRKDSFRVGHTSIVESIDWNTVNFIPNQEIQYIDLQEPLITWLRKCQEEGFGEDMKTLLKSGILSKTSSLKRFNPYFDEHGLMRVEGRLSKGMITGVNNNPILLPSQHALTEKIVTTIHQRLGHVGLQFTLSEVRQHYCIVHGRESVKRTLKKCLVCQKENARPSGQLMGSLPKERLDAYSYPFTHTAVDYFGPLFVQNYRAKPVKRYGVLFTCLTTRAVFLESAPSLSTPDFLQIFARFTGMYGMPKSMHSDNGTNFVGAEKELLIELINLQNSDIAEQLNNQRTKWHFQPPSAPHFGGAHETLVKSVKRALYKTLKIENEAPNLRYPNDEGLRTLLFRISGILNSRPLTYVSSDHEETRAITPNDFFNRP